ncbi:bam [Drosophila busckii]|uniref:Bam n=2 Tax=Drosophila busckii TaxID=30019 RepID=A0A0M4F5R5_DROBS|nr:bam [Drosophila busckii]
MADAENQRLNNNLQAINSELYSLLDGKESYSTSRANRNRSGFGGVLQELNCNLNQLTLNPDPEAPQFEFHGYGCIENTNLMAKRAVLEDRYKKSQNMISGQGHLVSRQKQLQLQRENIWNKEKCKDSSFNELPATVAQTNISGEAAVMRLLDLFKSMHEHIGAYLPSYQRNSHPSDYLFEAPRKSTMPKSLNVRHHVQVICTKVERFIERLRRTLEANRCLDFNKYTECDNQLILVRSYVDTLKQFSFIEMRHHGLKFVSQEAEENAKKLSILLLQLREHIKSAHLFVHVFNWEMDLEHRYSAAMTESLEATNKHALMLAAKELKACEPKTRSYEEHIMADLYKLDNIISCSEQHEEELDLLLQSPASVFPPEIIALCELPRNYRKLPLRSTVGVDETEMELSFNAELLELPPSSPPRTIRRSHRPLCNRS